MNFERREDREESGGENIALPEDPKRLKQLQAKLEEYRTRNDTSALGHAKIKVLETLLENGNVNKNEVIKRFGDFFPSHSVLEEAFDIIRSYAEGSRYGLIGGTGLPDVEHREGEEKE